MFVHRALLLTLGPLGLAAAQDLDVENLGIDESMKDRMGTLWLPELEEELSSLPNGAIFWRSRNRNCLKSGSNLVRPRLVYFCFCFLRLQGFIKLLSQYLKG